ncbi:MAG: NAD-dependent dihydropyrimidine dehydrogenase subunit PreA [Planctomycetes bacterium]|nr:NAD-dependent dihydropyrimidine dehydrogenase subunit PreA [Planctomycetota bacterium]HJO25813.1 NAD-dependent dihydropyrimidine dehydrogenase subunit PreA [Planctomycetota bacterium]
MTDLSITVDGIRFPNPFLLGSGPPGTNGKVIRRSFELGWGGVVCKTISLDNNKVHNTAPRYGKLTSHTGSKEVIGFQNIELISDRPFELWLDELAECKAAYPEHVLIASIMEEMNKDRWQEITSRVQDAGVDALELNLSCPHGLPERAMGAAMGQDPDIVGEVTGWVTEVARIPVWAKMTPNITDITEPSLAAVAAGADGLAAINTILCVVGINLETLRPMPTVEGHSVPGGYSGPAIRPIALRQVMEIARACPTASVSGMGGIECAEDAIQFMLVGAHTVQICTGAMLKGYEMIDELKSGLAAFMQAHDFTTVDEIVGQSLPYFTTHADLVERQRAARRAKAGQAGRDEMWSGDIAGETESLVTE